MVIKKRFPIFSLILILILAGSAGLYILKQQGIASSAGLFLLNCVSYLQKGVSTPAQWLEHGWESYLALQGVRSENERLKKEIADLRYSLLKYHKAYLENENLRKLLGLTEKKDGFIVAANVVGRDLAPWIDEVTVDKGTDADVKQGLAVRSAEGLVGKVVKSSSQSSMVLLITNKSLAVSAVTQRARVHGILKGLGKGKCVLLYVKKNDDVVIGDEIVTSGADGIIPKGISIGNVESIKQGDVSDFFKEIIVVPSVDFNKLEQVVILVPNKQG